MKTVLLAATALLTATSFLNAATKPNVLLILSDDLSNNLSCYGSAAQTPNLDALAKQSLKFDRAYCQFPLCGPSRCSFMSGLRPETVGVVTNGPTVRQKLKDVVTLPQFFRNNGYTSHRVGKIYHLGIPNGVGTPGPDDPQSWDTTANPKGNEYPTDADGEMYDPNPKNGQSFRRNLLNDPEGESQHDYQAATEAIRLLNEKKDKPFFLALGFVRPHVPEIAPKKFFDLYDLKQLKLPTVPDNDRDDIPPLAFQRGQIDFGMTPADCLESLRAYHATTSFMDAQVGRVLAELDRLHLRDNTIVVFMSDHGYSLGQHRAWQKMMLFEDVARVPLLVSHPNQKSRGQSTRAIVESIDLYPTLVTLAGLTPPKELEGRSFTTVLENPTAPHKDAAHTILFRPPATQGGPRTPGRSVRTDRYRYTEWDNGHQGRELYDHQTDPQELTNLAQDPAHAATVRELSALIRTTTPTTRPTATASQ